MTSYSGRVVDAGGGEVRIIVDRDTLQYPQVGDQVLVSLVHPPTEGWTARLDLTDRFVWDMADRSHVPEEVWNLAGRLASLHCAECGNAWPCDTRRALRGEGDPA